jgi:hypothetical protein
MLVTSAVPAGLAAKPVSMIRDQRIGVPSIDGNGGDEMILWLLVLLLVLLALGGGVAVSNFLFLLLIVALVLALVGVFNRSTV